MQNFDQIGIGTSAINFEMGMKFVKRHQIARAVV